MLSLLSPLKEIPGFDDCLKALSDQSDFPHLSFTGCADSQKLHLFYGLTQSFHTRVIITYSDTHARALSEEYAFYDPNTDYYPAKDLIFYQADIQGRELARQRLKVIKKLLSKEPVTVVTTLPALLSPQVPPEVFGQNILHIAKDDQIDIAALSKKLVIMGYEKSVLVNAPGQFGVRGDIIDIFDLTLDEPVRIELWGDNVESVRLFDPESQRSKTVLNDFSIFPATEMILSENAMLFGLKRIEADALRMEEDFRAKNEFESAIHINNLYQQLRSELLEFSSFVNTENYIRYFFTPQTINDFFPENTCLCIDEPMRCKEYGEAFITEFVRLMTDKALLGQVLPGQMDTLLCIADISEFYRHRPVIETAILDQTGSLFLKTKKLTLNTRQANIYRGSFDELIKDISAYRSKGYRVLILSAAPSRAQRLAKEISEEGIPCFYAETPKRPLEPKEVCVSYGNVARGFEYTDLKFAVITEGDIFGSRIKNKRPKKAPGANAISSFSDLKIGDFVVHESYGLGVYEGIETIDRDGVAKDYMLIGYRDNGKLYVPASGFDVLQKYASSEAKHPRLSKLGTKEWSNTKSKVRAAIGGVARELVELYAKRMEKSGYVYGEDTLWQREFEEMFTYEETNDQLAAISATKADMQSAKIMDRLICGDVGFGKTEIAIRAAFKAVCESRQVAVLVPTTILAQQHYTTFLTRMKDYPVRIDLLSRFRTKAEQTLTVQKLQNGELDIVIGTHRLLSNDIAFKNLGLLVVDEEQRFGVSHKEKIKQLRNSVDVLTLTATPIPRTLHMSMIGVRDLSVLEEAPIDRVPVQTYVCEYDEHMIRSAIHRELSRGGQIYYVYNRVDTIADMAASIQDIVPDAEVVFAHGQMPERQLELIMMDFINGDIDVLVSTTIIETGLDIPNVNTLIVHDADKFGLSQLYQLRGRVGRSNRTAYAFLMYRRDKILTEVAEKRLQSIRDFTQLGSGIKIALSDLEIRGAGNLLGKEQHGHMMAVGYEMYTKMLNDEIRRLRDGEEVKDYTTHIDIKIPAFIPDDYILSEYHKLDIYRRISALENEDEYADRSKELIDRFGQYPAEVENLLRISRLRVKAHSIYITEIKANEREIKFSLFDRARIDPAKIPQFLSLYDPPKPVDFNPVKRPAYYARPSAKSTPKPKESPTTMRFSHIDGVYFLLSYAPSERAKNTGEKLLSDCEAVVEKMFEVFRG